MIRHVQIRTTTETDMSTIQPLIPAEADPAIARGGCVLESAAGQVDARMETQLDLIEQALRGMEPQGIDDGSGNRPAQPGQ